MIDFRFLVKKSLTILKFMLLPVLLHTAAVKAEVTYIHTDYLGSVSAKSNASGQVIERFHYAPFGLPADSSELNNKQSYTGHVFDNESQLIYMQARYYDPVIGRFYSNDPVGAVGYLGGGNIQGFNRYTYANNNPYAYIDPDGNSAIRIVARFLKNPVRSVRSGARSVKRFLQRNGIIAPTPRPVENRDGRDPDVPMEPDFDDHDGNKPPFTGEPGSTSRGGTGSRTYGEDGYPETDRDIPHPDEAGCGNEDHCHDWGRPEGGGRPTHEDRGPSRPPKPGDPPKPRGPNVPPPDREVN